MLDSIKEWWHGLWVEHYELTVWFDDQTVTNLEDNTQTTTKSKKVFNLKTVLLSIPKLFLPVFIFYIGALVHSKLMGYILIGVVGVLGFALRNLVFSWIEKVYQEEKYQTLGAYKQKNT